MMRPERVGDLLMGAAVGSCLMLIALVITEDPPKPITVNMPYPESIQVDWMDPMNEYGVTAILQKEVRNDPIIKKELSRAVEEQIVRVQKALEALDQRLNQLERSLVN